MEGNNSPANPHPTPTTTATPSANPEAHPSHPDASAAPPVPVPPLNYDRKQAAQALGISVRLLDDLARQYRASGEGVPNVKLGGRVLFPVHMLRDWLTAQAEEVGR